MVEIAVWYEAERIGHEVAQAKYRELGKLPPHPAIAPFHAELTAQLAGVQVKWDKKSHVRIFTEAKNVARVRYLAAKHKLVCFAPEQNAVVNPPLLRRFDAMDLRMDRGLPIEDPSPEHIATAAHALSEDNWFMALEGDDDHFVQCGFGTRAGALPGGYMLEYRDGLDGEHMQAICSSVDDVIDVFTAQLSGSIEWRSRFTWGQLKLTNDLPST
jgi:hypothetical protein